MYSKYHLYRTWELYTVCSCLITGSSDFFSGNNSSKASWISGIISVVVIFRRYLANASLLQVLVSAQAPYAATRDRPYEHALREERKRQLLILLTVLVTGDLPFTTITIFQDGLSLECTDQSQYLSKPYPGPTLIPTCYQLTVAELG